MAEMLLQSHAGELSFLPALPRAWHTGSAAGLCARGGVEVDISWAGGGATSAVLRPEVGGEHKLRPPRGQRVSSVTAGRRSLKLSPEADGVVRLQLTAGTRYRVNFS
jgi:alpha-L-fucosidase 2